MDPEYREIGVSTTLIQNIIEIAGSMGLKQLTVEVAPTLNEACFLCEKMGFKDAAALKNFIKDTDQRVMRYALKSHSKSQCSKIRSASETRRQGCRCGYCKPLATPALRPPAFPQGKKDGEQTIPGIHRWFIPDTRPEFDNDLTHTTIGEVFSSF